MPANRLVVGVWAGVLLVAALLVCVRERRALRRFVAARWRELVVRVESTLRER